MLHLYWQVNPRTIHFSTAPGKPITARLRTDIFVRSGDSLLAQDHFISQTPPKTKPEELESLSILELRKYPLAFGTVSVHFQLTDLNDTTNKYAWTDSAILSDMTDSAFYSDVQLLDTFVNNDAPGAFLSGGQQRIPLCADFLDDKKRNLNYCFELYNLAAVKSSQYPLVQKVRLSKKKNDAYVPGLGRGDTLFAARSLPPAGTIPIGSLPSGNYYLSATLEDRYGIIIASSHRFFQRMNLHPEKQLVEAKALNEVLNDTGMERITVVDLDKSFLVKYNLAQLKGMLKMLLPVADPMQTNTINGFLKKPEEMYMRYFIHNYFAAINASDPGKAWKEYSDKVRDVNRKFSAAGNVGYETERGFIYLRYGPPTDVITVTNETGAMPYEIWQYNTLTQFGNRKELANSLFLFYKPGQMLSDYRLLHSTVPGEITNSSWRLYLYSTNGAGTGVGNADSRAEHYIGNR